MLLSAPLMLVIIGLGSLLAQWLAWLLKIPAILPLLLLGVVLGPVTHLVMPDVLFGELLFPLVSISVAIILFEGALTLRLDEVRGLGGVVRNLVTTGMLVTFAVISLACWWLLGFEPELAALVGAVTVVTKLSSLIARGAVIKATQLNENFGWIDYLEKNSGVLPLFAVRENHSLTILKEGNIPPVPCTLIALVNGES